jgi:hypothetical protein
MKKSVLFVEDNAVAQSLITEVFGGDYSVEIAGDYVSAMAKLDQGQFDLVITDVFFPQETGSGKREFAGKLAYRLRAFCYESNVREAMEFVNRAFCPGKMEVIAKEYGWEELAERMEGNLEFALENIKGSAEAIRGIDVWVKSADEADQPLGVLIAEECERRGLKFRMASSLFHHSDKVQALCDFARGHKWPSIFDFGSKGYAVEIEGNSKESRLFWEALRKEVVER